MRPPVVDQIDCQDPDYRSDMRELTGIRCTAEEDKARQEFKNEADVNWLLKKYGALPPDRVFTQGEVDFDLSLLDAKMAVEDARSAYEAFPRVLREQLSFDGFLRAVADGSFKIERSKSAAAPDGGSSGGGGDSASEAR